MIVDYRGIHLFRVGTVPLTGHARSGGQAFFLMNSDYRGLFVVRAR